LACTTRPAPVHAVSGLGFSEGDFPHAERIGPQRTVTLPLFPGDEDWPTSIVSALRRYWRQADSMSHRCAMNTPNLSVVIPVYNEEAGLQRCSTASTRRSMRWARATKSSSSTTAAATARRRSCASSSRRARKSRVILCCLTPTPASTWRSGRLRHSRGEIIVTLDADLQNPPEEIGNLLAKMREGHDYVGSIRRQRQDSLFRTWASKAMNRLRETITRIKMTDQGCMLRAYAAAWSMPSTSASEVEHLHSGAGLHLRRNARRK
jgi:hypothetical protein